jgi:CRISPR-associated protein Csm3
LRLLEDDSLGGGGSRGSGRVRFANLKMIWRSRGFYSNGAAEQELTTGPDLTSLQGFLAEPGATDKLSE